MFPLCERHQINVFLFFFKLLLCQLPGYAIFFEPLVSVINHYHINGLHLFWDNFEWFCLQINSDTKYFFLSCPRHCDQGLLVVSRVYYFQIWNKKEHLIISRVISSHMGPMDIVTLYIYCVWDHVKVYTLIYLILIPLLLWKQLLWLQWSLH